ncbi:MAG: response regulator [Planctomycetes bacterium]|nr:response regulator [Planctomycetota bacterium]
MPPSLLAIDPPVLLAAAAPVVGLALVLILLLHSRRRGRLTRLRAERAERLLQLSGRLFEAANQHHDLGPFLDCLVHHIAEFAGCRGVGVRLLDDSGRIPYEAYLGFSDEFCRRESPLRLGTDHCMCTRVIQQEPDTASGLFTPGGSFYVNGTTRLLASLPEDRRKQTRNACNEFGYESVALVPIRSGGRIIGLLHIADPAENALPLDTVEALEAAAVHVGIAIQRVRAEEALRRNEQQFRMFFEQSPDAILLADAETGNIVEANPAASRLLMRPREQIVGMHQSELHPSRQQESARAAFADAVHRAAEFAVAGPFELSVFRGDGAEIPVEITTQGVTLQQRLTVQAGFRDMTERLQTERRRQQLEERIRQAQKSETLAVLAGGIAHDFNNLLTGILGNLDLARMDLPPGSAALESLDSIREAAERAAELTRQMLAYAGKSHMAVAEIDLNQIAIESARLAETSLSKMTTLDLRTADRLPPIRGDAAQICQVLMNLIANASEAYSQAAGTVRVSCGLAQCDRAYLDEAVLGNELPEGRYACVEVSDRGCGMDAATVARLFDPFFSTRFAGRGLGMAAVLGIVRAHGGAIHVSSRPDHGTTVRVLLPLSDAVDTLRAERDVREAPRLDSRPAANTVLVVDDEDVVCRVACRMIQAFGFDVLSAPDGSRGVELFRQHAERIVAVMLDVSMPVMGGEEALREIRKLDPDVPVILCSGYGESDVARRLASAGATDFFQKPFEIEKLADRLGHVLGLPNLHLWR